MHFKSLLDGGGYGSYGVASTYYTGALQTVTYHVPRYKFQGARAFTSKPPCGPKRGHGTPQPRFALEVHLDKIARSEEHTSELQSHSDLVCRLLLEKKKEEKKKNERGSQGNDWRSITTSAQ